MILYTPIYELVDTRVVEGTRVVCRPYHRPLVVIARPKQFPAVGGRAGQTVVGEIPFAGYVAPVVVLAHLVPLFPVIIFHLFFINYNNNTYDEHVWSFTYASSSPLFTWSWGTTSRWWRGDRERFLRQRLHLLPARWRLVATNQIRQHGRQHNRSPLARISLICLRAPARARIHTHRTHSCFSRIYSSNFHRRGRWRRRCAHAEPCKNIMYTGNRITTIATAMTGCRIIILFWN